VLTFEDFGTELLTFELRFDEAYHIWDKAGALWSYMHSIAPDLRPAAVQPNQQTLASKNMQLTLELTQLRINVRGPKALENLLEFGDHFYLKATELLRLSSFTRLGYRSIRTKIFASETEALVATQPFAPKMTLPKLGQSAKLVGFTVSTRTEGDTAGVSAALKLEKREVNISAPWDAMPFMDDVKLKEFVMFLDCDYFTLGETDQEALNAELWIAQADRRTKQFWAGVIG